MPNARDYSSDVSRLAGAAEDLRGAALVKWARFDDGGPGVPRLERVFLMVLASPDGRPVALKVAGALVRRPSSKPFVIFSDKLLRVKEGGRNKRTVLADDLRDFEEGYPAGMRKVVAVGAEPSRLNPASRQGDRSFLDKALGLLDSEPVAAAGVPSPVFYLAAREASAYRPRNCGELVAAMRGRPEYSQNGSVEDNFRACFEGMFPAGEEGRRLVKLQWADGPGVVLADADFDTVWRVDSGLRGGEDSHFKVEVSP